MHHLTLRVAWHDSSWDGTICRAPSENPFCVALDRIREERDDAREDKLAGRRWSELAMGDLPPCIAESGGFMSDRKWRRTFRHPYQHISKAGRTHGHLKPTTFEMPPYAVFAVPFAWMLKENEEKIQNSLAEPLPPDEKAPFQTPWVFGRARQEALLEEFFGRLTPNRSLILFS